MVDLDVGPDDAAVEPDPLLAAYRLEFFWGSDESGGMYRGVALARGTTVSIRLIRPDLSADEDYSAAFEQQVERCRQLVTYRVAKVLDSGRTLDGRLFLVTEHVNGRSLRQIIDAEEVFGWVRVREITQQLLEGLAEGHRSGVVHWDLRPEAVWFETIPGAGPPNVRLTGFGLPWWPPRGPALEGGTLPSAYAAPERFAEGVVDARSDFFALGATLFHLLTGKPPFESADPAELARTRRSGKQPRMQRDDVPKGIPDGFVHLVHYLMAWSPADRPWDAEEITLMITSLPVAEVDDNADGEPPLFGETALPNDEGVIALGRPVVSREPSVLDRVAGHKRVRWGIAAVLVVAILVLLALILLSPAKVPSTPGPTSGPCPTQKASTLAMSDSPSSSITSRSTPSAMPAAGGTPTRSASR
jgi:serine/threonine-protein kinase